MTESIKLYRDRKGLFLGIEEGQRVREIKDGQPAQFLVMMKDVTEVQPGTKVDVTFQLSIKLRQGLISEDGEGPDDLEKRAWAMILGLGDLINPGDCAREDVEFNLKDEEPY